MLPNGWLARTVCWTITSQWWVACALGSCKGLVKKSTFGHIIICWALINYFISWCLFILKCTHWQLFVASKGSITDLQQAPQNIKQNCPLTFQEEEDNRWKRKSTSQHNNNENRTRHSRNRLVVLGSSYLKWLALKYQFFLMLMINIITISNSFGSMVIT